VVYLITSIIIVFINVLPAFMPPTWTVVSFVYIKFDVNLGVLAVIGAMSSSVGRYLLARLSHISAPKIFDEKIVSNLMFVGKKLNGGNVKLFIVAFVWALLPIGSNPLFIAVGLSSRKLSAVITGFFIGRCINYFSLAYAANVVFQGIREVLFEGILDWRKALMNVFSIIVIYLYIALDWQELFTRKRLRFSMRIFKKKGEKKIQ